MEEQNRMKVEFGCYTGYAELKERYGELSWVISVTDDCEEVYRCVFPGSMPRLEISQPLTQITNAYRKGYNLGFRNGQITRSKEIFALLNDSHETDEQE
jgi:hypothetical protein